MRKAVAFISVMPIIPIALYAGIVIMGATFRGQGPSPWAALAVYLIGLVGIAALAASTTRVTARAAPRLLTIVGLLGGIGAAMATLYIARYLLASPKSGSAYFVLLICLMVPVGAALVAIRDLLRSPPGL